MAEIYYHYTDVNAFKNVIEQKEIWATQVHYLNDYLEYNPLKQLIEEFIDDKQIIENQSPQSIHFSEFIRELWFSQNTIFPFVASFSEKGDLLSQWRSYAANGKGISLGFEFGDSLEITDLKDFFKEAIPGESYIQGKFNDWKAIKVNYMNDRWIKIIEDYLDNVYMHFKNNIFGENKFSTDYKINFQTYANPLWIASIGSKNQGFVEENEVRLINFLPINIFKAEKFHDDIYANVLHYRSGKHGITPYIKIEFDKNLTLKEIILGPRYFGRMRDVEDFLYKNKYDFEKDVNVRRSEISYQ